MSDPQNPGGALPPGDVDVGALAALFDHRRASHAFLLFFALLDEVEERGGADGPLFLPIDELVLRALGHAWVLRYSFRLSFGRGDRIGPVLDRLPESLRSAELAGDPTGLRQRLRETLAGEELIRLGRYVLRRLVRPFFVAHLRPAPDAVVDRALVVVARERLAGGGPLYRLDPGRRLVEVEPAWRDYLRAHGPMVRGWASWRWALHLQARNPLALGLAHKLFPAPGRPVPEVARRYWRAAVEHAPLRCPFSGDPLDPDRATLDAFVPWGFLGDDPLWNLVPVSPRAGAAKGDRFPDPAFYLEALAETQAAGIVAARETIGRGELARALEPFFTELRLQPELALGDAPKEWLARALRVSYEETLRPLEALARRQGFETGWRWSEVA